MSKLLKDASTYSFDVEDFIAEVKKYPVVWDLNSEDNRYKSKKQAAWGEIAKKFILNYDDLSELDKTDAHRKLHNKWRNIRDSYVRHIKRRESRRGYMYARNLAFLNNLYNPEANSTDDENNENGGSEEDTLWRQPNRRFEHNGRKRPSDTADNSVELKRQRIIFRSLARELYGSAYTDRLETDDRYFFASLIPALDTFTLDQTLDFQCEVLKTVQRIRRGNLPINVKKYPMEDGSN